MILNMKELKITKVENGFILEGEYENKFKVVECDRSKVKAMKKLLIEVMNYYGVYYDSKSEKTLEIRFRNVK